MNVLNNLSLRLFKKKSSRSNIVTHANTANCPPPTKSENDLQIGHYCIHASSNIYDSKDSDVRYVIGGYDDNTEIAQKVENACQVTIKDMNTKENTQRYNCTDHRLFFMGEKKPCSGQIYLMNKQKDILSHLHSI
jgi:hypothetical protein